MKLYLYDLTCGGENLYLTGDNYQRVYAGITYTAAAIESKEISYDLKELMGEVNITLPFAQAGYLQDFTTYPFDFPVNVTLYSYETGDSSGTVIFKGFVNSFKCSKGMIDLGCLSFLEQCRDNYPRTVIARHCCHRVYDNDCGLSSGSWTTPSTILGITTDRLTITATGAAASGYYSYGYLFANDRYRYIVTSTLSSGDQSLALMHPCPTVWTVGQTVYLVAGCDRSVSMCQTKFNNYEHFLGFPYTPFESIRMTGLRASEVQRSKK